jgi:hypothetical protein
MKRQEIDLPQVYGYQQAMLDATRERRWFTEHSEPAPPLTYDPNWVTEAAMTKMIEERTTSSLGIQRKLETDLRPF